MQLEHLVRRINLHISSNPHDITRVEQTSVCLQKEKKMFTIHLLSSNNDGSRPKPVVVVNNTFIICMSWLENYAFSANIKY